MRSSPRPQTSARPKIGRPFGDKPPRDQRVMFRVHQDLIDLVDLRAEERGESRSRFIEKLLVAFLKNDPRNPRIDAAGRIESPDPLIDAAKDPVRFGAAWARFESLNGELFNMSRLPQEWLDARLPAPKGG